MLTDPETGAAVELHTSALHRRSERIMPAAQFHENARAVAFRGSVVRLPHATRSAGHNIVHYTLDHEGYRCQRTELRQLLDLALIQAKHETAINWAQLDQDFSAAGVGHVLAANLKVAERLLGQPVPRNVRLSERRRWARDIARMPGLYVAARCGHPWGVFNLLRPKTWADINRRARTTLGVGRCDLGDS